MDPCPVHEALKPIKSLIGKWKSKSAKGTYPTIEPFIYNEEINFTSFGQPNLNYSTMTWKSLEPDDNKPMHMESGFLKIKPGTDEVSFLIAHNFGLTSVEEGMVVNNVDGKMVILLKSKQISRASFAKEPAVIGIERQFILNESGDELEQIVLMETSKTPMTEHLRVSYKKV